MQFYQEFNFGAAQRPGAGLWSENNQLVSFGPDVDPGNLQGLSRIAQGKELLSFRMAHALADVRSPVHSPHESAPTAQVIEAFSICAGVDEAALGHSRFEIEVIDVFISELEKPE